MMPSIARLSRLVRLSGLGRIARLVGFAVPACLVLAGFGLPAAAHAADELLRHATAPTRVSLSDMAAGKRDRVEFAADDFKGWLRRDGEMYVEAGVTHAGLLCAQYRVGLRFGAGSPGCENVTWLSGVVYATQRNQCNSAAVEHAGGATDPALSGIFDKVTCAERVIRCTGNCR